MSSYPTFVLIEKLNHFDAEMEQIRLPYRRIVLRHYGNMEQDLQSRQPEPFIEFDHNGKVITSEVIGYTDTRQEIWC